MTSSTDRTAACGDYATSNVSFLSDYRKSRHYIAEAASPDYPASEKTPDERAADAIAIQTRMIRRALRILERRARQPGAGHSQKTRLPAGSMPGRRAEILERG